MVGVQQKCCFVEALLYCPCKMMQSCLWNSMSMNSLWAAHWDVQDVQHLLACLLHSIAWGNFTGHLWMSCSRCGSCFPHLLLSAPNAIIINRREKSMMKPLQLCQNPISNRRDPLGGTPERKKLQVHCFKWDVKIKKEEDPKLLHRKRWGTLLLSFSALLFLLTTDEEENGREN